MAVTATKALAARRAEVPITMVQLVAIGQDGELEPVLSDEGVLLSASTLEVDGDVTIDVAALEAKVGALNVTKVIDPDAASASLNALLRGILSKIITVDGHVDGLEGFTDGIETALATLSTIFGAVDDSKVIDPDAASATSLALLRGILSKVIAVDGHVDGLEGFVDGVETALATLHTDIGTLTTAVGTLNTAIGVAADEAGDETVIGLLKQIAANTTPE